MMTKQQPGRPVNITGLLTSPVNTTFNLIKAILALNPDKEPHIAQPVTSKLTSRHWILHYPTTWANKANSSIVQCWLLAARGVRHEILKKIYLTKELHLTKAPDKKGTEVKPPFPRKQDVAGVPGANCNDGGNDLGSGKYQIVDQRKQPTKHLQLELVNFCL